MDKILTAVSEAVLHDPDLMTADSIGALVGGHGMLNLAGFNAANAIARQILNGRSLKLEALNQPEIEMDRIVQSGVEASKLMGADSANAALITAALCYMAGANVRAGVPSGNRKLGAMARMKAGTPKGSVATLPTPKANNKISGFPAVHEIYHLMMDGKLTQIDGRFVPPGISGSPICGHSVLGEDYIFPEVAENAARAGTQAMMRAYAGAGLKPNPFISAIFGAAATLEIVHPDCPAPDRCGPSFHIPIHQLVGSAAAQAAGLPDVIHFRVTGEEFKTATVVGDLGMILKDMGTPTVVGMLAFYEIFGCFVESPQIGAGGSGGPKTAPIGHVLADATLALRTLSQTGSISEAAEVIRQNKETFFDPEMAALEANTVGRKMEEIQSGPVSKALVQGTEGRTFKAIEARVLLTQEVLGQGGTLADVLKTLAKNRIQTVETRTGKMLSKRLGKEVEIRISNLTGGGRRSGNLGRKIWVLDPEVDVTVRIDGEEMEMQSFCTKVIPEAVLQKDTKKLEIIALAAPAVGELLVSGHTLLDLQVPAAVAAILGQSLAEACKETVQSGVLLSGGLPGCEQRTRKVAQLAVDFFKKLSNLRTYDYLR